MAPLTTTTTTAAASHQERRPHGHDRSQSVYRYDGAGRFLPVNDAALAEVAAWNNWAARVTLESAHRRQERLS